LADADRIARVVTNFLTNAIRYSPPEGPITVSLRIVRGALGAEEAVARVEVRDHGPGIPEKERERIWERFERASNVQQEHDTETGLGVGLYICRQIIEGHGGRVGVGDAVGGGAMFWFTLPIQQERNDGSGMIH